MKISFDFDGVIEINSVKKYATELIERGFEVWVVTSRFGDDEKYKKFFQTSTNVDLTNRDLWKVAEEIGISKERVHFTNMIDKWYFFKDNHDFIFHLDDDEIENYEIEKNTKVKTINFFGNPSWRQECERILENYSQ